MIRNLIRDIMKKISKRKNTVPPANDTAKLQSIDFFIPLPESIDIANGINFPLIEYNDLTVQDTISFTRKDGVSLRFNSRIMFHQIPVSKNTNDTIAAFKAFDIFFGETRDDELKLPEDKVQITVVQVSRIIKKQEASQELLSDSFDEAIESLRRYQKAYHFVTKHFLDLVTRQTTSTFIPYSIEDIDEKGEFIEGRKSLQKGIFFTHEPDGAGEITNGIGESQLNAIAEVSSGSLDNLLDAFSNVRREAVQANRRGNSLVSVLLLGIAAETLLDEVLLLLLWEEGVLPSATRSVFRHPDTDTAFKRAESDLYASRLGGNWDTSVKGSSIRKWRYKVLELRNKVAHTGYEPSQIEMKDAIEALTEMLTYIIDLLCKDVTKYPIATTLLAGTDGMNKRGCQEAHTEYTKDLPWPSDLQRTFGNWKYELERLNKDRPFRGNFKKATLGYLLHANGQEIWVLLDDDNRLALPIERQVMPEAELEMINNIKKKAGKSMEGKNLLIELPKLKARYKKDTEKDWYPSYVVSDNLKINRWPITYLPPEL